MKVERLVEIIGSEFFTGVPDSQLKPLCNYLVEKYGSDPKHHIIAANEGNCTAIAAGYYLSTNKIPVIYMQNSGEGNIINPVASLLNEKVYSIPAVFIIGWRGQPGVHDEPQHIYQGEITLTLLKDMDIESFVISPDTSEEEITKAMDLFREQLDKGKQVAFVVKKNALETDSKIKYKNDYTLVREEAIRHIVKYTNNDPIVSTTGKASRELFEIREANGQGHGFDFLTVGSMGHSSSIALGISLNMPDNRIWCIDGDGAALMHLGAMAVLGSICPENFVHIIINNEAHETVGGMPTVSGDISITDIAKACGYNRVSTVSTAEELDRALEMTISNKGLQLIEVKCSIGARDDLGRPTTTAHENKENFMYHLKSLLED